MEIRFPFERMLAYDAWANDRALASVEALPEPHPKALGLVGHVLGAQAAWISRMTAGREPDGWERWDALDAAATRRALAEEVPALWRAFLADAALADPAREFSYRNYLGQDMKARVEVVLQQLLFHGNYHRGQIASMVRAAGGTPAVTDYIAAVRQGALG